MRTKYLKPLALLPGSEIAVLGPASPVDPDRLEAGVRQLICLGYRPRIILDPAREYGRRRAFTSDSAKARAAAFNKVIKDKRIGAVWSVRGGFGSMELLPLLDYPAIRRARKPIIGYSDISALLVAIAGKTGLGCFHGPMVGVEMSKYSEDRNSRLSVNALLAMVCGEQQRVSYRCRILRSGSGNGPLLPANLSMLCALIGTPWEVSLAGHILVLEDINEPPYKIHRLLLQLKLAGRLKHLQGVVFGRFSGAESSWGPTLEKYLSSVCQTIFDESKYPVCCGLQFGHAGINLPIPVGCRAELTRGKLTLLESPVANEC